MISIKQHRAIWITAGAAVAAAALMGGPWRTRAAQNAAETSSGGDFVTYDAGFSRWLNAPKTVEMSQGVTLSQEDTYLKMDSAIVNLDGDQRALNAKSLAPVHIYDPQSDLTAKTGSSILRGISRPCAITSSLSSNPAPETRARRNRRCAAVSMTPPP